MHRKSILAMLALLFCLALLSAVWTAPAIAEESDAEIMYACTCKGIKNTGLSATPYGDCGNGYKSAKQGHEENNIFKSNINNYLPQSVVNGISGTNCGYYEQSGWNCGMMKSMGGSQYAIPICVSSIP